MYGAILFVERCGKGCYVHLIIGVHVFLVYLLNQLIGKYILKSQSGFQRCLFCFTVDTYLLLARKFCVLKTGNSDEWFCESFLIDWFNSLLKLCFR